jgi:NAD kinase
VPALDQKVVIVTRKTRLEELIERFNTREQARFYVTRSRENSDVARGKSIAEARKAAAADFTDYENEHSMYHASLKSLRSALERDVKVQVIERGFLPNFLFGPSDVVVPVGQDGLVANTAKYALGHPIVGVNPDVSRFDGVLLPFDERTALPAINRAMTGRANIKQVVLAEALLNDGQRLVAFNDLFIGSRTHVSARYRIEAEGQSETHSSSGVLVSTGAGSTGWLSSIFNMAMGLHELTGGTGSRPQPLQWDDERLCFVVREPFVSKMSQAGLVAGIIHENDQLLLESYMPTNGIIFSDGIEADFMAFNAGAVARVKAATERAYLVV